MPTSTCPVELAPTDPVPFLTNGNVHFKAHQVGWIVCGFLTSIATVASAWLIWKHLTYYTCSQQQRHIVRMLLMVPIYAIISTLSYIFYTNAVYYATVRDCYEAVVITSFFNLLLQYVGDTPAEQQEVFRQIKLKKWFWPLGFWKYRPNGLHFLWLMKIGILQYAILQPICTLVAVGLQYFGLYCLPSWAPYYGHIWLSLIISISISLAMYNIIQLYIPIAEDLKPYSPVLKFLAIKSIVFLTFWQDSFLSVLVYFGAIKKTEYFTTADIQVGLGALLVTFEMMVFAFVHIKAFTYVLYRPQDRTRTTRRFRALLDVFDFRDWWYDMKHTTRYVTARRRGKDLTVADDIRRKKYEHLEKALGRDRMAHLQAEEQRARRVKPNFWKDGKDYHEEDLLKTIASLEKETGIEKQIKDPQKEPKRIAAMRDDYDPEKDDQEMDLEASAPTLITPQRIPRLLYGLRRSKEAHPELSQYHRTATEDLEETATSVEDDEGGDIFVPRKGGRHRKEASLGLGAWWRSFRERVSNSAAEVPDTESHTYDDNRRALLSELGRGIDPAPVSGGDDADEEVVPNTSGSIKNRDSIPSDVDVTKRALRSDDSPLSSLIKEHRGHHELTGPGHSPKIMVSAFERRVAVVNDAQAGVTRQSSSKAAVDSDPSHLLPLGRAPGVREQMDLMQKSMAQSPPVNLVHYRVDPKPIEDGSSANPLLIANCIPSIGGGPTMASPMLNSNSRQQRPEEHRSSSTLRSTGPKGMKIPLKLPLPLSPGGIADARIPLPQIDKSSTSRSIEPAVPHSASSSQPARASKLTFVETKPSRNREDDPEAEPVNRAGTVVVGGQSLNQVKQRDQRISNTGRVTAGEQDKNLQRSQQRLQDRDGSFATTSTKNLAGQMRARPAQSQARAKPSDHHSRMGMSEPLASSDALIALPAPPQLRSTGKRQDSFAAAFSPAQRPDVRSSAMVNDRERHIQHMRGSVAHPRERAGRPSLEVGSIVTHQDILNLSTPHAAAPMSHSPPTYERTRQSQRHSYGHHHTSHAPRPQRTFSALPLPLAGHQAAPPQDHHRVRHSTGTTAFAPPARAIAASYDRWTGEPAWKPYDGRSSSRVQAQRREFEARDGFYYDYLD